MNQDFDNLHQKITRFESAPDGALKEVPYHPKPGEWIGVDLDGTLFTYDGWTAWNAFGEPILPMVQRVRNWLAAGIPVKIFTARVACTVPRCLVTGEEISAEMMTAAIQDLLERHELPRLDVTCKKDHLMIELWDDRCVQVVTNAGRTLSDAHEAELAALRGGAWQPDAGAPAREDGDREIKAALYALLCKRAKPYAATRCLDVLDAVMYGDDETDKDELVKLIQRWKSAL